MSAFWIVLILVGILVLGFLHRYQFIPRLEQRLMKARDKRIKALEDLNKGHEETILSLKNSNDSLKETINNQQVKISTLTAERQNQSQVLNQMNMRVVSFQNTLSDPIACLEHGRLLLHGLQKSAARGGNRCAIYGCLITSEGNHAGHNGKTCPVTRLDELVLNLRVYLITQGLWKPHKKSPNSPTDSESDPERATASFAMQYRFREGDLPLDIQQEREYPLPTSITDDMSNQG